MSHDGPRLTVRRTETVPTGATVRDVDELPEGGLDGLLAMADGERVRVPGVEAGDVVVFTSYLEVVPAESEGQADGSERRAGIGPVG